MDAMEQPDKPDVIRYLLEEEGRVMLCLDATRAGVETPSRFHNDPGLRLVLNRNMPQPIHIGPDGVESELRFGGIPHYCIIPYDALWGAFNPDTGHGMLWPESMPDEIRQSYWLSHSLQNKGIDMPEEARQKAVQSAKKASEEPTPTPAPEPRPAFRVIDGATPAAPDSTADEKSPTPPDGDGPPSDPPQRGKPNLRLIK
ncbi:ClpXP protease specificity-enhancing factor SspB [Magnetofaba australis]|uniref:Putative stringent starvation protein B n=1 Tax=Magnetofaba australis IT-1 TaxID=1434232 RepID=A0A1Y2K9M1_9PROT|nr:ClpXP protease specificity-enhancing factor SspB [Magnetofaba australis]OSM06150.1 putative stringent starvation protein B [Magnetofaba australis IT-1]